MDTVKLRWKTFPHFLGYNVRMASRTIVLVFCLFSALNSWADFHSIEVPDGGRGVYRIESRAGITGRQARLRPRLPRRIGDAPLIRPSRNVPAPVQPVAPNPTEQGENDSTASDRHAALLDVGLRAMGLRGGERDARRAAQGMASRLNGLLESAEARRILAGFSDVEVEASRVYSTTGEVQLRFIGADETRVNTALEAVSRFLRRSRDVSFVGEAGVLGVQ